MPFSWSKALSRRIRGARLSEREADHNALSVQMPGEHRRAGAERPGHREALSVPNGKRPNPWCTWSDLEPEPQAGTNRPLYLFILYWSLITEFFKTLELVETLGTTLYVPWLSA